MKLQEVLVQCQSCKKYFHDYFDIDFTYKELVPIMAEWVCMKCKTEKDKYIKPDKFNLNI